MRGVAVRIRRLPLARIKEGAVVDGRSMIEVDLAYQIDNMEGIAVHRTVGSETIVTVVSDDNFSFLQRNLLLQFAVVGELRQHWSGNRSARFGVTLLYDLALEFEHSRRQVVVVCLEQKCIQTAAMVDSLQGVGRHAQPNPAAEGVGDQRDVAKVRQKAPLGLDVGMTHFMADQWLFTGQVATP